MSRRASRGFVVAAWLLAVRPGHAQRMFGTVARADGITSSAAVVVTATADDGRIAARDLATARGDFVLPLPRPGSYTITVAALGAMPVATRATIGSGQDLRLTLATGRALLPVAPVGARTADICTAGDTSSAAARAWGQFVTALATTQIAAEAKAFSGTWDRSERTLGRFLIDTIARRDTTAMLELEQAVMETLSPDSARDGGFVVETPGGVVYHTPDVAILSSPAFREHRCLSIAPPPATQPAWFGVHFRPERRREGVVDVEGTLWLDRETYEPRALGFRFVDLPPAFASADAGGALVFVRLPTGHWIVDEWMLRAPTGAFRRIFAYDSRNRPAGFAAKLTLDGVRIVSARLTELDMNGTLVYRRTK